MRFGSTLVALLAAVWAVDAASTPLEAAALDARSPDASLDIRDVDVLAKRKGGGGGRGGGSGSGRGSSGGSSSGGSSRPGNTLGSSNKGGTSSGGSGVRPKYGSAGAPLYAGGASVPYRAGGVSGVGAAPYLIGAGVLGGTALIAIPAILLAEQHHDGVYFYPYNSTVSYFNATSGKNETHPASCFCIQYQECSCSPNTNSTYIDSVIGNGSTAALRESNSGVAPNGTLYIDGSLPNGTTASGAGLGAVQHAQHAIGWAAVAALVAATVLMH